MKLRNCNVVVIMFTYLSPINITTINEISMMVSFCINKSFLNLTKDAFRDEFSCAH